MLWLFSLDEIFGGIELSNRLRIIPWRHCLALYTYLGLIGNRKAHRWAKESSQAQSTGFRGKLL